MGTVYLNAVCAAKTLSAARNESFRELIGKYPGAYYLGSIAEELFCFFDCFSREENTWIRDIASKLGDGGVALFDDMKNYIGKAPAAEKDVLRAYFAGMATDFACDYRTGGYLSTVIPSGLDRTHLNEEYVKLDCCLMKECPDAAGLRDNLSTLTEEQMKAIEKMYSAVISEKRRIIIPEGIVSDCVQKLIRALGQKKSILPIPKPGREFSYSPCDDRDDVLNLSHRKWTDLNGDVTNFSLPEMIGYAVRDASKLTVKLLEAADRAIPTESCEFLFRNLK